MDADILESILELLAQSHDFGESISDSIELWISVSFALIGAAFFAPDRLNVFVATFLIVIYAAFTLHTFGSVDADVKASQAALSDAKRIAAEQAVQLDLLDLRASNDPEARGGSQIASNVFVIGLAFGVIGFVALTCVKTHRKGTA